jgi:hypothetical protein
VTHLGLIERSTAKPLDRIFARPAWNRRARRPLPPLPAHSSAATRFAVICAALGGTTMLHDLMPDVVTVTFGSRTSEIWKRLRKRGWNFVGKGEWRGEPVLGVSFAGDKRAMRTVDDLAAALIRIVREMEVAETRLW